MESLKYNSVKANRINLRKLYREYNLKQKSVGFLLCVIGMLSCKITGDGTAMILLLIIGVAAMLSKENITYGD